MVRHSYQAIIGNMNTYLKAEETFALTIVSYFQYDLNHIYEMNEKEIQELLGEERGGVELMAALEKAVGEEFYIITQDVENGEVVRNKTALYYATYKAIAMMTVTLQRLHP